MKKALAIALILILTASAAALAYNAGIRHAIEDSEFWTLDPLTDESIIEVHVLLDDNWYVHETYIG